LKILVLTFYYKPDLCAGSFRASAFIEALQPLLTSHDSVDVITTIPNRYRTFIMDAESFEKDSGINIIRMQIPAHKSGFHDQAMGFSSYLMQTIKYTIGKDYDVVFATSSRLFTAFLGALIAKMKGAYLYLDIRDIFTDTMRSLLSPSISLIVRQFLLHVEKFTILAANKVNLVSKGFHPYFLNVAPGKDYSFYTNGIDQEFIGNIFEKDMPTDRKIITYAGNIGQGQGLEKIIPDIAKLTEKEYDFWVVGDGGMRLELENKLKKMDVTNVILHDPVGRNDLIKFYRQSDYLFLHLNNCIAFDKVLPSKIFEYAATGKPIIAGVNGFARKFISKHIDNAVVFEPCNSESFLCKFRSLKNERISRETFIKKNSRSSIMQRMAQDFMSVMI